MNDRELLELAAKAAGIEIVPCTCHYEQWPFKYAEGQGKRGHWNPLTDDGDALRLAVKLRLHILHNDAGEPVLWVSAVLNKTMIHAAEEFADEGDRAAATRRAIVRAAAEIGRAIP
jgi:hypothetical protein